MQLATLIPIVVLVVILFYLSHKEIRKSLDQSKMAHELLEHELKETRKARLDDLAKAAEFGRFAQGLFHDLMSPLTSILLHTEKIEKVTEASRRMAVYIKDMRATLAKEEVERLCSLKEELESVLHFLSYQARGNKVEIIIDAEEIHWFGSPTKIRQVFSNLISNAIDSFDEVRDDRKRVIEIKIKKHATIILTVKDNGCGIPEQDKEKVFDSFFTTKAQDKGTGIGLATVKSIVEKHLKGTISFESTVTKGTSFTISFPPNSTDPDAYPQPPHRAPDLV